MKKNIFELFLEKAFNVPLWIKQVMYLRMDKVMCDNFCDKFLKDNSEDLFSIFVPTLTFKGKTELSERKCGLDNNIYNFLQCCSNGYSMIEISVNNFLSMEEVAKYFELCIEQNFIKTPESKEINAMAGFIAGKYRTGEYFKQKDAITVDQLHQAIIENNRLAGIGTPKRFGEVLVSLGFITENDLKAVLILKDEAKKRFILDYNTIPKPQIEFSSDTQKYEDIIAQLKEENSKLKRKMLQLLELVKRNDQ